MKTICVEPTEKGFKAYEETLPEAFVLGKSRVEAVGALIVTLGNYLGIKFKEESQKDIPDDLVLLPETESLSEIGLDIILKADWYECQSFLLASAKEIQYLSEDDPLDAGCDITKHHVVKVDDVLKRGCREDGFYHG